MSNAVREAGWYWICRPYESEDVVPAFWQPEYLSWQSVRFGGIPDCEVKVISSLTPPPHGALTNEDANEIQNWKGMDGAIAYHLIKRHANGWNDVGLMMRAWLVANGGTP